MPQLDPTPWFIYMTLTWIILVSLAPSKVLGHLSLCVQKPKTTYTHYTMWTWPW